MATEDDDLNDLEREIETTDGADEPKDEDFIPPEVDDDPEPEPEYEPEPVRAAAPEIADDLEIARTAAAKSVAEWEAYHAANAQALADARTALATANESGESSGSDIAQATEALQRAVINEERARTGLAREQENLTSVSQPRTQAAQSWINANPRFKTDQAFRDRAMKIATELQQDYRSDSPKMYQELDRRMRAKTAMGRTGARTGGAPTSRQPGRVDTETSGPSPFDKKWMRNVGLDPNNKTHFKEWRKNYNDMVAEA